MKKKKKESFQIGDTVIKPGESKTLELNAGRLYTHTPLTIPIRVISGKLDGPSMFLCGGIHGDEINGVEIIRRLLSHKSLKKLRGTLVAVPVVNVHGFITHDRYLPDRRDLNRSFPGNEKGSLTSRLAHLFTQEIVEKCTHGIDLHTASGHRFNLPQVRAFFDNEETLRLAHTFGSPVILNANIRDGSLRQSAVEGGKTFLLYEAGEALRFDEFSIRLGVAGILSVMRVIGMLPGKPYKPRFQPFVAYTSSWVRAPEGGIFHIEKPIGSIVTRGELLGKISDPMGETEVEITSSKAGAIISVLQLPLVNRGDAIFHIAHLKGSQGDPSDLPEFEEMDPEEVYPHLD